MTGTLYVVATPIGNLEDLSARALRVLGEVALVAAEDTRVTRRLFARHGLRTPLTSCHAHTPARKIAAIVARLREGADVAVVSDAGTPGVSDPGGILVREALAASIPVTPVPGASAVLAALAASGLDAGRFLFHGFLPRARGDQKRELARLRELPHTLVFYESAPRLPGTLETLRDALGSRRAVVARELTKKFEEFARGPLEELETRFREAGTRGECVILVEGCAAGGERAGPGGAEERLRELLGDGVSVRDAARQAAEALGLPRREVYALALEIARAESAAGPEERDIPTARERAGSD